MIKGSVKFKRPKLTVEQKALKKAITPLARETKNKIRGSVPVKTGALKWAIDYVVKSKKGNAYAVIGVRSRFEKNNKIPNLYGRKVDKKYNFLKKYINKSLVDKLAEAVKKELELKAT